MWSLQLRQNACLLAATSRAVSECLVPYETARDLADSRGLHSNLTDPESLPFPHSTMRSSQVDHGKTTLLGQNEASREPGGITQSLRLVLMPLASSLV